MKDSKVICLQGNMLWSTATGIGWVVPCIVQTYSTDTHIPSALPGPLKWLVIITQRRPQSALQLPVSIAAYWLTLGVKSHFLVAAAYANQTRATYNTSISQFSVGLETGISPINPCFLTKGSLLKRVQIKTKTEPVDQGSDGEQS